ncbi:hypothetical protein KKA47_01105 [bacterium]|nr:hypothetical protein [bacterium]
MNRTLKIEIAALIAMFLVSICLSGCMDHDSVRNMDTSELLKELENEDKPPPLKKLDDEIVDKKPDEEPPTQPPIDQDLTTPKPQDDGDEFAETDEPNAEDEETEETEKTDTKSNGSPPIGTGSYPSSADDMLDSHVLESWDNAIDQMTKDIDKKPDISKEKLKELFLVEIDDIPIIKTPVCLSCPEKLQLLVIDYNQDKIRNPGNMIKTLELLQQLKNYYEQYATKETLKARTAFVEQEHNTISFRNIENAKIQSNIQNENTAVYQIVENKIIVGTYNDVKAVSSKLTQDLDMKGTFNENLMMPFKGNID